MSRDSSGNYSLPAGNPVVTGTTIEASWANTTMSDVATALTNSLDRTGKGAMTASLKLADGSITTPGVSFNSETNSGLYRAGSGDLRIGVLGSDLITFTASGATVSGDVTITGEATLNDPTTIDSSLTVNGSFTADDLRVNPTYPGLGLGVSPVDKTAYMHVSPAGPLGASSSGGVALFEAAADAFITIASDTDDSAGVLLGDSADSDRAGVIYNNSDDNLVLRRGTVSQFILRSGVNNSASDFFIGDDNSGALDPQGSLHIEGSDGSIAFRNGTPQDNGFDIKLESSDSCHIDIDPTDFGADQYFRISLLGSETLRVTSDGNVGIGTSSPSQRLDVSGDMAVGLEGGGSEGGEILLRNTAGSPGAYIDVGATDDFRLFPTGNVDMQIGQLLASTGSVQFFTNTLERMRIASNGNVGIGTTSPSAPLEIERAAGQCAIFNRTGTDGTIMSFLNDGSTVGSISFSGSTTSYNTTSDVRLKDNIEDALASGPIIDGIDVRRFDWKADGSHQRFGMVAQELEQVFPEAVSTDDTEGGYKSVDYSKLVPLLVKEIQSLRSRVEQLGG